MASATWRCPPEFCRTRLHRVSTASSTSTRRGAAAGRFGACRTVADPRVSPETTSTLWQTAGPAVEALRTILRAIAFCWNKEADEAYKKLKIVQLESLALAIVD
ncbi:hypothetical protein M513_13031 [Trichuris suis]|uniref:Uncharacterized protein n=1 Tax=Trichuris suis TaxID=68888 RepID=A0A085LMA1_9BILA|nr:hypothetical protein M513_13031 [Trichuris suis]